MKNKRIQAVLTGAAFFIALVFCSKVTNPVTPTEITREGFAIRGTVYSNNKPYQIKDKSITGKVNILFSTNGTPSVDDDEIIYITQEEV